MDAFSELAAVSHARGCGPVPIAYPLSGTGPSKPLGKGGIAYPPSAGVPACARGAAAADVGECVFSRVRDANMNEESYTYVAAPHRSTVHCILSMRISFMFANSAAEVKEIPLAVFHSIPIAVSVSS